MVPESAMNRLILGGARSGKSRYAQGLALARSDSPVYLATSRRWDDDHAARIARHKADRDARWTTVEEETSLSRVDLAGRVVVVDCLTLWLTNLFHDADYDFAATQERALGEIDALLARKSEWLLVSNEVGMGVHAETPIGRKFCDLQGTLNQHVAARVAAVTLMVAGIPLAVKGP